jgi:hypothetical protein
LGAIKPKLSKQCELGDDNGKRLGVIKGHPRCGGCKWMFNDFDINCIASDDETKGHVSIVILVGSV